MYKVVKKSEANIRQISPNKIALNFITKETSDQVSFAVIEATDYYEKEKTLYNRIYYVLEGNLVLIFNGEEFSLNVGDSCYIEKKTTYEMKGTFKAAVINQPAFGV